jgi:uncharacterized protein YcbK (DUF882 family)
MSKFFTEDECRCKCCGQLPKGGMDKDLMERLDALREAADKPLTLSCAYRCPTHNAEVGGVPDSQHVLGLAADVLVPDGMSVEDLAELAEGVGFNGVGRYFKQDFVHVDTRSYSARWDDSE